MRRCLQHSSAFATRLTHVARRPTDARKQIICLCSRKQCVTHAGTLADVKFQFTRRAGVKPLCNLSLKTSKLPHLNMLRKPTLLERACYTQFKAPSLLHRQRVSRRCRNEDMATELFDALELSILSHCCQVQGCRAVAQAAETLHRGCLNHLSITMSRASSVVLAECGDFPLQVHPWQQI